jgi:cytochrome d ubiquinol oxidase subunit II
MTTMQFLWFALVGVLLAGYAVLDGFDLGVGLWYPLAGGEEQRRTMRRAIGPTWDANEVWLLTAGGALFAAFPAVYATVFSGLYLALMLVLVGLILRAAAIELRGHADSPAWRRGWDAAFAVGSALPALLVGVAMGNLLAGLPLDAAGNYTGTFFGLLGPYALLTGVAGLVMFAAHGALYLTMKTDGELADRARRWASGSLIVFALLLAAAVAATAGAHWERLANFQAFPALWLLPAGAAAAAAAARILNRRHLPGRAFIASSAMIVLTVTSAAVALFPRLVPAANDDALSLTAANASSGELTLRIMFLFVALGMPIVGGYTIWVYRTFRGKTAGGGDSHY